MPVVIYVSPSGEKREIEAKVGASVMRTAIDNLVPGIVGECGGELSCATCHVFVDESWAGLFGPMSPEEKDMLEVAAAEPTALSRLSCQLECTDATSGMVVYLPEEQ